MGQGKMCFNFLGMLESSPGKSCDDIHQLNKASREVSGLYCITTASGTHQVYCNMELQCGGHKGGWTRVAQFDTSQGDACPPGWNLTTTPGDNPNNVCQSGITDAGCHSTIFITYNISFYKICGEVRGYQKGNTNAFRSSEESIDGCYVDGVSIMLGYPRKHVWTYAIGRSDTDSINHSTCPCATETEPDSPSFVSDHYYCESGNTGGYDATAYYTSDPVWDWLNCSLSVNCCAHPDMPWFL